jgi:hypothetical protein
MNGSYQRELLQSVVPHQTDVERVSRRETMETGSASQERGETGDRGESYQSEYLTLDLQTRASMRFGAAARRRFI